VIREDHHFPPVFADRGAQIRRCELGIHLETFFPEMTTTAGSPREPAVDE
jgi:hypothetical protein